MVKFTKKFLAGGAVMEDPAAQAPAEGGAPMEGQPAGAGSPEEALMQLAEMAMQALLNQDCQAMAAVCEGFLLMIQGMQGGAPAEEPIYRRGGRLVRKIKRD